MASLVEVVLNPGDLFFGGADTRVHTLLGSCVSVTIWHPQRLLGGMCHYMLPRQRKPGAALDGRYADHAIRILLREVERHGTAPVDYLATMYGGGNQFLPDRRRPGSRPNVAHDNIEAGLRLLDRYRFPLVHTDLGGTGPRRLTFDIATGEVSLASDARRSLPGGRRP